jgi:tetratricopeptide (TPR) repeat protein
MALITMLSGISVSADQKALGEKPTSAPTAISGNRGVSVVAQDTAHVTVNQTINQINQRDPELAKALLKEIEDRRREQAKREQAEQESAKLRIERNALASDLELAKTYLRIAQDAQNLNASEPVKKARETLLRGDLHGAERLLLVEEERSASEAEKSLQKAARFARERAALAEGRDTATAVSAIRKATEYEPDDLENWWRYGDILKTVGKIKDALAAYNHYHVLVANKIANDPSNRKLQRDLYVSYLDIGAVQLIQGKLLDAFKSYCKGLNIAKKIASDDPSNPAWQHDLVFIHWFIGDLQVTQGKLPEALNSFGEALNISKKLVDKDPSNNKWKRDLFVSYLYIGDVQEKLWKLDEALISFR